jgi:hypothetical protein
MAWIVAVIAGLVLAYALLRAYGRWRWAGASSALLKSLRAEPVAAGAGPIDLRGLQDLPVPVQRYLRAVLRDGQALPQAVQLSQEGTFNMAADGDQWKPFSAEQRALVQRPGFIWDARIRLFPGVDVHVHDAYVAGQGLLHAAVLGAVPMARLRGGGELAEGELMRWLAEAVWYPAALLPGHGVRWQAVDRNSADASLADGEVHITLLFHFDSDGLVDTVTAAARGRMVGGVSKPAPWQCRLWNYAWQGAQRVPMQGEVAWLLPGGASPYWRGRIRRFHSENAP